MIRTTHTFVILELSAAAFKEIHDKLKAAGYEHTFQTERIEGPDDPGQQAGPGRNRIVIDMHGIALAEEKT